MGPEEVDAREETAIVELFSWRTVLADAVELLEIRPKTATRMIAPSIIHRMFIDTNSRLLANTHVISYVLRTLNYGT